MGAPSAGSVVLVPFPFSDLSQSKLRRAVMLADVSRRKRELYQSSGQECAFPSRGNPLPNPSSEGGQGERQRSRALRPSGQLPWIDGPFIGQAYFLWALPPEMLPQLMFPLGELTKPEVRQRARHLGLVTAEKPESMEICFVPSGNYVDVLEQRLGTEHPALAPGVLAGW